jgi:predicted metalloprotease with PDZ domain
VHADTFCLEQFDDYSREKTAQWAAGIHRSGLSLSTKIDNNKTTLGLVLTDDHVQTVLPGGPAFLAGLRKGDCIIMVGSGIIVI